MRRRRLRGGAGLEKDTRKASAWITKKIGTEQLHHEAMSGRGDTEKCPPAAANKAGAQGCLGARPAPRGRSGGRREKQAGKTLGVHGDKGGCETTIVVFYDDV